MIIEPEPDRHASPASAASLPSDTPRDNESPQDRIDDLCEVLKRCSERRMNSCIGILADECNGWYRIWPPRVPVPSTILAEVATLDQLLQPGFLDDKTRLELGVQLASAVMCLHKTEWLSENWGKRDVFFFQRAVPRYGEGGKLTSIREPVILQPFIRGRFGLPDCLESDVDSQHASKLSTISTFTQVEKTLFSLGIILMELWFEKPIEQLALKGPAQLPSQGNTDSESIMYEIAQQRVGELLNKAGKAYGLAVWHCLQPISSFHCQNTVASPADDEFKNEVYANIVHPLEQNLNVCCSLIHFMHYCF